MKKHTKVLSAVLAFILIGSTLTGCEKEKTPKEHPPDKVNLSVFMHFIGYCVYDDQWPIFKEAAEITGVSLTGTASKTVSDSEQAFNTMLASKRFPDIIHGKYTDLNKIGKEGTLIPLEDLISKYAPHIRELLDNNPDFKNRATADDGHIYYLPGSISGLEISTLPSTGWFIRQDWLDKLGMQQPTTIDELVAVWTAFRNNDPNGNGVRDEIPFFARVEELNPLFNLFDTQQSGYMPEDGRIIYVPISEKYKTAVKNIAKWYADGLIDEEIFTRGNSAREQLLGSNTGGSCHDWFSSTGAYSSKYSSQIPGINFIPMPPVANINGDIAEYSSRRPIHGYGWGISKDNAYPEKTMEYFDFWYTEEGKKLISYGVEGVHYNTVDGKNVLTDTVLKAEAGAPTFMREIGQVEIGAIRDFDAEYQAMGKEAKQGFDLYMNSNYCRTQVEFDEFTDEENSIREKYAADINVFATEQLHKWIMGAADIDSTWDNYVEVIKSMHLDEVTAIYQAAYDRKYN